MTRKASVSPTGRKFETPGWFEIEALIASARTLAKGVQISPAESVNDRRQVPSAVARVYVPGMPRIRQLAGTMLLAGSAESAALHAPVAAATALIGSKTAFSRVRLVKFVL